MTGFIGPLGQGRSGRLWSQKPTRSRGRRHTTGAVAVGGGGAGGRGMSEEENLWRAPESFPDLSAEPARQMPVRADHL